MNHAVSPLKCIIIFIKHWLTGSSFKVAVNFYVYFFLWSCQVGKGNRMSTPLVYKRNKTWEQHLAVLIIAPGMVGTRRQSSPMYFICTLCKFICLCLCVFDIHPEEICPLWTDEWQGPLRRALASLGWSHRNNPSGPRSCEECMCGLPLRCDTCKTH